MPDTSVDFHFKIYEPTDRAIAAKIDSIRTSRFNPTGSTINVVFHNNDDRSMISRNETRRDNARVQNGLTLAAEIAADVSGLRVVRVAYSRQHAIFLRENGIST